MTETLRIDKWLWHARFFKSRTLAGKFVNSGKVRMNGAPIAKAHVMASDTEKSLKGVKIFAGFDDAALAQLADKCRWESVEPEVQIITHQDSSNDVMFVIAGTMIYQKKN